MTCGSIPTGCVMQVGLKPITRNIVNTLGISCKMTLFVMYMSHSCHIIMHINQFVHRNILYFGTIVLFFYRFFSARNLRMQPIKKITNGLQMIIFEEEDIYSGKKNVKKFIKRCTAA